MLGLASSFFVMCQLNFIGEKVTQFKIDESLNHITVLTSDLLTGFICITCILGFGSNGNWLMLWFSNFVSYNCATLSLNEISLGTPMYKIKKKKSVVVF